MSSDGHRTPLRLLHTSDLHIGDDAGAGDGLPGLQAMLAVASRADAQAILIAGDLFDNGRLPGALVDQTLRALTDFARPVIVLPGNHDTILKDGAWMASPSPNVRVLAATQGESVHIEGLGLTVWGRPVYDHVPTFKPLEAVPPRPESGWYVAMAHGLFMDGEPDPIRSSPIAPHEIESAGCDYVALGHVHAFREVSQGRVMAFYSGAPSGSGTETVAVVDLDPLAGVSVTAVEVGGPRRGRPRGMLQADTGG